VNFLNIQHEILGYLRYDNKFCCYEGQVIFHEKELSISLSIDDHSKVESMLTRASSLVTQLKYYTQSAKEYAVEQFLKLKNETWLDENETCLTSEEFQNRMTLAGLVFSPDGEVDFYYNDGNLFFGHCILITMNKDNCFIAASISG
jgi:hypothetical protein